MEDNSNKNLNQTKAKNIKKSAKNDNETAKILIKFVSKEERYIIPDYSISVNSSSTTTELNELVNNLMKNSSDIQDYVDFDFLIRSQYLRTSLIEHIKEISTGISTGIEEEIIECIEKHVPPEPKDCLIQDDWISAVALCDKWILTGSYDNTLHIWDLKGRSQLVIPGHTRAVKSVAWISLDDEEAVFASTSMENNCIIWNWNIKENSVSCMNICEGHKGAVDAVSVNHNKTLMATGSWDKMLYIWSTCTQDEDENGESASKRIRRNIVNRTKTPKSAMKGHKHAISGIVWSDKTEIITSSWDHTIKIWDSELGGNKQEIHGENSFFAVDYSPLSRAVITASADPYVKLYDPRSTGVIMKTKFTSHKQWIAKVCWSTVNEYFFISGSYDTIVKMWDTRSPKAPLFDLIGHDDKVLCCDWSNPEWILSGGADNTLRIFKSNVASNIAS